MGSEISIALDGPAGSGKSSVAKLLAREFGYIYIDTGAMYRAIALKALEAGIDLQDELQLTAVAEQVDLQLVYEYEGGQTRLRVWLDGKDVSEAIRSLEVTAAVSSVAAVAGVRRALVNLQRKMARSGGVVMDGRDIGTVVLPEAELKVFLTASVTQRGQRRWLELQAKGVEVDLAQIIQQIEERDYYDSHREVDPLRPAEDAVHLDTTEMDLQTVLEHLVKLAEARGAVRTEL